MKISFDRASAILSESLLGEFILLYEANDYWLLRFSNGLWLIAQEITSPDADRLNLLLGEFEPSLLDGVDPGRVAIATLLMSQLRRPITAVGLDTDAQLSLHFAEARRLDLRTDVDIVDWQWSLGTTRQHPYVSDFTIACYWRGEVEVPE